MPGWIVDSREIGSRVKKRRSELGITQEQLAAELNISYQQVQRYENGTNKLNTYNLQLIARILHVPVTYFFGTASEAEPLVKESFVYLSREEIDLCRAFRAIRDKNRRQIVLQVANMAAGQQE